MIRALLPVLLLLSFLPADGQGNAPKTFGEQELVDVIRRYHPVARGAGLGVDIARAGVTAARGAFDPAFRAGTSDKMFDGTSYYDRSYTELKIPTWYGIDLYAGTENLSGSRTNPEETRGKASYVGANLNLVQGLVFDKRRAALQRARVLVNETDAERRSTLNDLLQEARVTYWEWWAQHQLLRLVDSSLVNARQRYRLVRQAYQLGDRPAIDTLEALTQVQTFELMRTDVYTRLFKARLELSAYLWRENNEAWELPENIAPDAPATISDAQLDKLLGDALAHPDLQQYTFKLQGLRIDRRLKFQSLLPDVDLKYQQLGKGYDLAKTTGGAWFDNNYRFGVSVAMPLRLSQGRGEFRQARLKIDQTLLLQANKQVQIQTKVKQYFTEWQQTSNQLSVQAALVNNFATLQRGEEIRFANGESSLFLINARELKTLESRQKAIELQSKNRRALVLLRWAAGNAATL